MGVFRLPLIMFNHDKIEILKSLLQSSRVATIGRGLPNSVFVDSSEIASCGGGKIRLSDSSIGVCSQRSKLSTKTKKLRQCEGEK